MITPKIKALFHFIEYLNSNIDSFNLNNDLIKELELLFEERQKVRSKKTFKDKLKYDEVQAEIETKFDILQGKTANLIKEKAKELNVCNFDNVPNYSFNGIETDIRQLKENFSKDDLPEIFKHKQQYIEYRKKTHKTFFSLAVFIDELDEITKSLFDYFKETEQNEFEAFESKAIQGNDIGEAVKLSQSGKFQKFPSPNSFLNPSTIQQQPNIEPLPPINSETDTEKYTAKHYLLAYLFECNAKGESYPIGYKKKLERIGNERMGAGKGNRFYKVFNEVINKDLNAEKNLFEIGGEYWRKAVIELSKAPELVENYLQSKQL
ncbi:MAG: hypothetical protein AB7D40_07145 [Bacteroidales bacterium]